MALKELLHRFAQKPVFLTYRLEGTEKLLYDEVETAVGRLKVVSAALALYPIKDSPTVRDDNTDLVKRMRELTDGKTPQEVDEMFNNVVELMKTLNNGAEAPYHTEGTITTSKAGAMLNWSGRDIGFPFEGATQKMQEGHIQQRIAEKDGDNLHLKLVVDGGDAVASLCVWTIDQRHQQIKFTLKEARYWDIPNGYGRVLLNQEIQARGTTQVAA